MRRIAVFDLNQTLYSKSSKEEFFKFVCYRRNYKLTSLFQVGFFKLLGELHALNHTDFKENFFRYLDGIPPEEVREMGREFWSIEYPKYFNEQILHRVTALREAGIEIVLATGTLELYVEPLFALFPVDGFCGTRTEYDGRRHHVVGEACKEAEKLRRLDELYGADQYLITEAYSDDPEAMLDRAVAAFIVDETTGEIRPVAKTDGPGDSGAA